MTRALILTGQGHYADPWHPYDETSRCIAGLLAELGIVSEISGEVDERMSNLATDLPDLVVINAGDPAPNFPDESKREDEKLGRIGLLDYLASGRPLLGVHTAATSLRGVPEWRSILGGTWVRGQSFHPDYGPLAVTINRFGDEITSDLANFTLNDERYSNLALEADNAVLASHVSGAVETPLVWRRTWGRARSRVVVRCARP
jgi:type 1 glutamine amidotransferase